MSTRGLSLVNVQPDAKRSRAGLTQAHFLDADPAYPVPYLIPYWHDANRTRRAYHDLLNSA